jgi:hypothetical protein
MQKEDAPAPDNVRERQTRPSPQMNHYTALQLAKFEGHVHAGDLVFSIFVGVAFS